jgi:multidrug efflux pump subunit AcrA (membrane-fusion protein)
MTVEANIVLRETPDAVLVPPAAVVLPTTPAGTAAAPMRPGVTRAAIVWVVEKEVAHRRAVEIGVQGPRATEIRRGLSAGQAVVIDPPATLRDGQAVRLRP